MTSAASDPRPPRLAEWLMAATLDARSRVAVLGDLQEEYGQRAARHGAAAARRWYWAQTRRSLVPNLRRRASAVPAPAVHLPEDRFMSAFTQDIRFAWRMMRRQPLVSAVAVLSLTLGIALSAGVFGLLDAAVLRPLPVRDPGALRVVLEQRERSVNHNFTYPGFDAFRRAQTSFTDVVAYSPTSVSAAADGPAFPMEGELVSGGYFETLSPPMRLGRGLVDADNVAGTQAVVLSRAAWRELFGDPSSIDGRHLELNGRSFAVVGVADAPFRGMQVGRDARFWAPLAAQVVLDPSDGADFLTLDTVSWLTVLGRLREGVTDATAEAEVNAVGRSLTQTPADGEPRFFLAPGGQGDSILPEIVTSPLTLLLGASLLVLVVACANVAGLLLSRAGDRGRELAVRTALGATRTRLARLLFVESAVIGLLGVAAGLVAAHWVAPLALSLFAQFGEAVTLDVGVNLTVLLFASLLGLAAAMGAGLAPVLRVWRAMPSGGLADGGRGASPGPAAGRWRRGLVAAQFALTLALIATSGLLVRTLVNLRAIPTGLDVEHVALLSVSPESAQYEGDAFRDYVRRAERALSAVPGVRAAAYGRVVPLGFGGSRTTVGVPGYEPGPDEDMELNYNVVAPGYFEALGIGMVDGRAPSDSDGENRLRVVVVNETMANRFWPGGRAVGRTLTQGPDTLEVIGVARDVKYRTIREEPRPSFYLSLTQLVIPRGGVLHVRTAGDPAPRLASLREALAAVDPAVPITAARTLSDQVTLNVNRERATMSLGLGLGGAALALSAVGLFGLTASLVGRRRREMGVRLALGAIPGDLSRLVLRESLTLAIWGSVLGVGLAFWLGRLVESRLYGVGAFDLVSLLAAMAVLTVMGVLAAWVPSRRAARVDPVMVLREN
jgi:predicted permease